ncbi:uncharacterized protein LOC110766949 [Prunus avium]|uniref:Uncharacterized protein LOC110766949 n=1 Tax=Prunus avium TaxID=42229 RepID=A0A6P5TFR2_PRUAV|nr:uncharacterized protein LOC110766949 [Prunus avium]
MNIAAWNVRGAGKNSCARTIKDLKKTFDIDILAVLEPRISGSRALTVAQNLGFSHFHIVDAIGFSGGVWLLWNGNSVSLQVVAHSSQSITALVTLGNQWWLLTVVYANPCQGIRESLWNYFDGLARASHLPWLVLGDFNDIVSADEKCGGNLDQGGRSFIDWIDRNQLVDLGFSGAKFTWCNKRNAEGIIWKRLDRGLCNIKWRLLFPEAHLSHLPRVNSDHCPVLVSLDSNHYPERNCTPFRFQAMWMSHPDFPDFIHAHWNTGDGNASQKAARLKSSLISWNRQVFGCLFQNKRRLLARLAGIQRKLCLRHNPHLCDLEDELTNNYNLLLEQEELFWLHKSRNTWLKEGDKNSRFFHLSTIIRRRRNKLEGLNNDAGAWTTDKTGMKQIVIDYFQGIFCTSDPIGDYSLLPHLFPQLEEADLAGLNCAVSNEEIKESLFNIGGLKTPGPDGFPAIFYQKFWEVCSNDIISFTNECFQTATLPDHINETLIALVPKVERPVSMTQLRPISLCNTLYKVVSKILVARLRPCMTKLVSPNQVSFVPGRQITDNIVIAQEVLHKFKTAKGKKGFIAWKIDLSKAYDRLHWHFIREVLWEVGIRGRILELLMQCFSTVQYKAILNGELTAAFSPHCGIRQGDPLSPYIFVLCMEKLSHLIQQKIHDRTWKPIQICHGGPKISHLFFADDLILFGEASIHQAHLMKLCLEDFCQLSSQKVSFDKSRICVSPNICSDLANSIAAISGSPYSSNLGKYLGVPLIHTRVDKTTYQEVIAKVQKRLASWKHHTLSMAGRITLLQSVTAAIPLYTMQTVKLPVSVCDRLDQLNRNFLWGHTADKATIHLVNWETSCKPKTAGGLGIKKMAWMNQALLAKSGWRLLQHEQGLWAEVFKAKYLKQRDILTATASNFQCCSSAWRGVLYGISTLSKGLKWRVGSGENVRFWTDNWLSCGPLQQHALFDLAEDMLQLNVSDFLDNGTWELNCLRECLPDNIIQIILSTHAGFPGSGVDKNIWRLTPNGDFSVKSAYNTFSLDDPTLKWAWEFIWQLHLPPKTKTFLWLFCHKKLLTNVQRQKRGLTQIMNCPRCAAPMETIEHLSKDCPSSIATWIGIGIDVGDLGSLDFDDWILLNLKNKRKVFHGLPWHLIFTLTLWFIWKWRCKGVFDQNFTLHAEPRQIILQYANEWYAANKPFFGTSIHALTQLSWNSPNPGSCKINSDGSRNNTTGHIGAAGVLRDTNGGWLKGYSVNLGIGSVLEAELWGIFWGLSLAWDSGFRTVEVESDSKVAVTLINTLTSSTHPFFSIINCCKLKMGADWNCSVRHIFREQNCVADALAAKSFDFNPGLHIFDEAPAYITDFLAADTRGDPRSRLIFL